ncbi:hypothetical protein ABFS83_14G249400 [Erythranthe nasuta]
MWAACVFVSVAYMGLSFVVVGAGRRNGGCDNGGEFGLHNRKMNLNRNGTLE